MVQYGMKPLAVLQAGSVEWRAVAGMAGRDRKAEAGLLRGHCRRAGKSTGRYQRPAESQLRDEKWLGVPKTSGM